MVFGIYQVNSNSGTSRDVIHRDVFSKLPFMTNELRDMRFTQPFCDSFCDNFLCKFMVAP